MEELGKGVIIKDRYSLKEFKGSGSFGEVWLAHDEILDSDVAIKIYITLDPRGVEEFKREYITTLGISHPNLLTTTYFDVWEQRPFLVMKYCANGSSSELAGKIDEYALWQFIHDVAAGLRYLHNMPEPIIHQDIKPDNVLVDENGHYLITDFGISKKIRSTMRKQSSRAVGAGATAYMGPERFESDPSPVKASDIWSLGVSIYELATGELPFSGLGGGMQRNGAELPALDNKWSKDMTMVMQSCLAKNTWDRPTAQQIEEFSAAIINGQPAEVTWNPPCAYIEEQPNEAELDDSYNDYGSADNGESRSNRKAWIAVGTIAAAIVVAILIWSSQKTSVSEGSAAISPDTTTMVSDTGSVAEADTVTGKPVDSHEVAPLNNKQKSQSTPGKTTVKKQEKQQDTPKTENKAALLKAALSKGDYSQVQKLANQGCAAAYGPLAKYYLRNHDYRTAEVYAKKAKAAGFSEGSSVLKTLENLGYYD